MGETKVNVEYCAKGLAVPDFEVEMWYNVIKKGGSFTVSTSNIINRVRVGICEGDLFHEDVTFEFRGEKLRPDAYGRLARWPDGFCDLTEKLLERLLEGYFGKGGTAG